MQRAFGVRGMGCTTAKATKKEKFGCIVPPNEPVEILVEYVSKGAGF